MVLKKKKNSQETGKKKECTRAFTIYQVLRKAIK